MVSFSAMTLAGFLGSLALRSKLCNFTCMTFVWPPTKSFPWQIWIKCNYPQESLFSLFWELRIRCWWHRWAALCPEPEGQGQTGSGRQMGACCLGACPPAIQPPHQSLHYTQRAIWHAVWCHVRTHRQLASWPTHRSGLEGLSAHWPSACIVPAHKVLKLGISVTNKQWVHDVTDYL